MSPFGIVIFIFLFIGLILLSTWALNQYINFKRTPIYVTAVVWIGWFFSFFIVFLIPLDVASSNHAECLQTGSKDTCYEPLIFFPEAALAVIWKVIYWTTYFFCWTVYPILQSYVFAGDFTFCERFRTALKENIIFYLVAGVILGILLIIIVAKQKLGSAEVFAIAIASANAWGLFLLICLLGYGLVEIPKLLWRKSNKDLTLKYVQFQLVGQREDLEKAKKELTITLKLVKKYSETIRETDPFRPFINIIIKKCPIEYKDALFGEGDAELLYSKLVALHTRLMWADHEYRRCQSEYDANLKYAFELEDLMKSANNPERVITRASIQLNAIARSKSIHRQKFEWVWKIKLEPIALKIASLLCAALSIIVIWSELVFWIPAGDYGMSIFSLLVNESKESQSFTVVLIIVFLPVAYIASCAYWSLFKLKLFTFYRLIPHQQTDPSSILFSAAYLCRLAAPLAYNFLLMGRIDTSAFYKVMGLINLAPLLGSFYNIYFPMVLVVLALFNVFNVYTKIVATCCVKKRFIFDESFNHSKIEQGKEIMKHERELREKGITSSALRFQKPESKSKGFFGFFNPKKEKPTDQKNLLREQDELV